MGEERHQRMELHVELAAETLFHIGPIPVTNSMLMMFIVMGLLVLVGSLIARRLQMVPGRTQGVVELIVEFLLGLVEGTAGKRLGRRIFPLVGALFIFIIFSNWTGLLPGVGTIGYYKEAEEGHASAPLEVAQLPSDQSAPVNAAAQSEHEGEGTATADEHSGEDDVVVTEGQDATIADDHAEEEEHEEVLVPYFRAPNADLNMTLAMALLAFGVVQVAGVRAHGFVGRIKHMADPPMLFPIELISELSRIVSLSARLFGNVFAGEVLLAVMYAMAESIKIAVIPLAFPVVFLFLELLFGSIQALVFALLTLIYITLASAGGHGDEHHDEETHHAPEPRALGGIPASAGD
jgi:F-type H+-transporting ATPase subunit a